MLTCDPSKGGDARDNGMDVGTAARRAATGTPGLPLWRKTKMKVQQYVAP